MLKWEIRLKRIARASRTLVRKVYGQRSTRMNVWNICVRHTCVHFVCALFVRAGQGNSVCIRHVRSEEFVRAYNVVMT